MPEQREGSLLQILGDHTPSKHQPRNSLLPGHTQQTQHPLTQQFQHSHGHQHQISSDWITSTVPSASPANSADFEPARELAGGSRSPLLDPAQPFSRTAAQSPSPQRSSTPDLQLPVVTDASILNLTSLSRYDAFSCVVISSRDCHDYHSSKKLPISISLLVWIRATMHLFLVCVYEDTDV